MPLKFLTMKDEEAVNIFNEIKHHQKLNRFTSLIDITIQVIQLNSSACFNLY